MGFWHEWRLDAPLGAAEWEGLKSDAQRLFDALPEAAAESIASAKKRGFWGAVTGICLGGKLRVPARPGFGTSLFGESASGAEALALLPGGREEWPRFEFENAAGGGRAKTEAAFFDRAAAGILCAACERSGMGLSIGWSDGDAEYWRFCRDWASKTLERPLPLPPGIEGWDKEAAEREEAALEDACRTAARPRGRPTKV